MTASHPEEFLELSREIGSDPLLVQGPGGNSSYKLDGTLWIKASGTRLSDSLAGEIFVPVDLSRAVDEIHGHGDGSCRAALLDQSSIYRPSIETTLHAALSQRFVFHYHSVNSICHTSTIEGRAVLPAKLAGLSWTSVAYCHPGVALTRSVLESLRTAPNADVVMLENHGVIVAGESVAEIRDLVNAIEERLALPTCAEETRAARTAPEVAGWTVLPEYSRLALDPLTRDRARRGSYYPDHVVFLGPGIQSTELADISSVPAERFDFPAVVVPNVGVYIRCGAPLAAGEMLQCLHDVLTRVPVEWTLDPIGAEAGGMLLNWDAEKHRQALARRA